MERSFGTWWFGPRTGVIVIAIVSLILVLNSAPDVYKSILNKEERSIYHGVIIKCPSTNDSFLQDNKFSFIVPVIFSIHAEFIMTLFYILFTILMINGVYFLKKIYCYLWLGLSGFFMVVHFGTVIIKFIHMMFNSCPIPFNSFFEIISIWVLQIYFIGMVYNYSQKLNEQMENISRLTNGNDKRNDSSTENTNTLETKISSYDNFGVAIADPENRHSVHRNPVRMLSFDINN